MKKLEDLFEHQLKDLYSSENQLIDALPKMEKPPMIPNFRKFLKGIWRKPKTHKKRLEEVCDELGIKPTGEECKATKGLIKEALSMIEEDAEKEVKDAGLIADAQRAEHYEISAVPR